MNFNDLDKPLLFQNETDLLDLEQNCRIIVEKKSTLEGQLKETQCEVYELMMTKLDLEKKLESQRREIFDTTAQLNLLQTAMQQWEHDRMNVRETTAKQKLQIESLIAERNLLNEQVKNLEIENLKLKSKVNEIENKLFDQKALENMVENKKASINSTFELIFAENKKIEKEYIFLRKNVTMAKNVGEEMIKLLTLHHQVLNRVYSENDKLKEQQYSMNILNLSNGTLQEKISHVGVENYLQECQSMILALDRRINEEIEEKNKLNDSLKSILKEQMKYIESQGQLENRTSEMEKSSESIILHNTNQIE